MVSSTRNDVKEETKNTSRLHFISLTLMYTFDFEKVMGMIKSLVRVFVFAHSKLNPLMT